MDGGNHALSDITHVEFFFCKFFFYSGKENNKKQNHIMVLFITRARFHRNETSSRKIEVKQRFERIKEIDMTSDTNMRKTIRGGKKCLYSGFRHSKSGQVGTRWRCRIKNRSYMT